MGLIPLSERRRIDLNDSSLDERVGPDQLVVRSVVHLQNMSLVAKNILSRVIHTTLIIRVLRVTCSEPQAKLPESRRRARYLRLPPRTRTECMRFTPSLVLAAWRPSSNFRFLR
jgi:hypothetical protein